MELQKIKGNCSLWSLIGNDKYYCETKALLKKDLIDTILEAQKRYPSPCDNHYVMLVTNFYSSFLGGFYSFDWGDYRFTKNLRHLGFKKVGNYKENTTIMVAKIEDILNA